jgi:hypothetical protein
MKIHRRVVQAAWFAVVLASALVQLCAQVPPEALTRSGEIVVRGERHAYRMNYLPVNSFPELPARVAAELQHRGCRIPQTWQAHRPENVVQASLERPGSEDWAVLCAVDGDVSLLVFFSSGGAPVVLAQETEVSRLLPIGEGIRYGFGWGIDPATPEQVHQAQAAILPPPDRLDHDALADCTLERRTVYHFFTHGVWTVLTVPN